MIDSDRVLWGYAFCAVAAVIASVVAGRWDFMAIAWITLIGHAFVVANLRGGQK